MISKEDHFILMTKLKHLSLAYKLTYLEKNNLQHQLYGSENFKLIHWLHFFVYFTNIISNMNYISL